MSNPTVHIPLDVLFWWYRKAQEAIERYDRTSSEYPKVSETYKQRQKEGYEMALKTVDALKDVFEERIICEVEDTNHE